MLILVLSNYLDTSFLQARFVPISCHFIIIAILISLIIFVSDTNKLSVSLARVFIYSSIIMQFNNFYSKKLKDTILNKNMKLKNKENWLQTSSRKSFIFRRQ